MDLKNFNYSSKIESYIKNSGLEHFDIGRVVSEHKDIYVIKKGDKEYYGEITGNLRYSAESKSDLPSVGDWVSISEYDDDKVIIHHILPRNSKIERGAVGKGGEKQIIATNIDIALIVQAVDRDFNINRLERYLTICHNSKIEPVIVITKIDLIEENELNQIVEKIGKRVKNIPILPISSVSKEGYEEISNLVIKGKTYCLLGSSGAGKSTISNNLYGEDLMKTSEIGKTTQKGIHTTTYRQLIELKNGAVLIDNPGMREVGIADSSEGIKNTFEDIIKFSKMCKFRDCKHINEKGCMVIKMVEEGEIDQNSYKNYLKMEREKDHFNSTVAERREKYKKFGKMVKTAKKIKKNIKDY